MDTHMERTQVYIPKRLKQRLRQHALHSHRNVSDLLREGADRLLKEEEHKAKKDKDGFKKMLDSISGIWADRDPKEFEETRRSADRIFPGWND